MIDLFAELKNVSTVLQDDGVRFALVGGLAYSLLVELRATEDIDLLVEESSWSKIAAALSPHGYSELGSPMDFAKIRMRRLSKVVGEDVLVLDFLFADDETRPALDAPLLYPLREGKVPVAPPQIIIALKKRRLSKKDINDIAGLEEMLRNP